MKKVIMALMLSMALCQTAFSQDLFNQVVNKAQSTMDDPQSTSFQKNVAKFKYKSMEYTCKMAIKRNGGQVEADFLNQQAVAMNDFITNYFKDLVLLQGNTNYQKQLMKQYWEASNAAKLYNDSDTKTTEAFINDPESLTPFSLDTDWVRANAILEKNRK